MFGWYSTASDAELFKPVKPKRVWDSRQHTIIPAGGELTLKVTDIVGVPSTATAVVLNVTVTAPVGSGFLTVYAANVVTGGFTLDYVIPVASSSISRSLTEGEWKLEAMVTGANAPGAVTINVSAF